jgi:hypothetical protein
VAWLLYHLFPVLALPLVLLGAAVLVLGGVLSSGLLLLAVVALLVFSGLVVVFVALAGMTSPLWVPILAVVGLVALVRAAVRRPA